MDFEAFDRVMKINVNGVFNSVKAEVCAMKKQNPRIVDDNNVTRGSSCGVIINIASLSGLTPGPNYAAYGTSKHAVVGLTKIAGWSSTPLPQLNLIVQFSDRLCQARHSHQLRGAILHYHPNARERRHC